MLSVTMIPKQPNKLPKDHSECHQFEKISLKIPTEVHFNRPKMLLLCFYVTIVFMMHMTSICEKKCQQIPLQNFIILQMQSPEAFCKTGVL